MSFELTQNELQSYKEKYDKIIQAKVQLNFSKTKKIIMDQFSITEMQANSILNKVFAHQQGEVMNREGFFTTLRYIQCLQNGINIDTCNINTIKLSFPLKVNSKKKLRNSFQPPSMTDDPLGKSMLALNQMQSLIKVDQPKQPKQPSQIQKKDEELSLEKGESIPSSQEQDQQDMEKRNSISEFKSIVEIPKAIQQEKVEVLIDDSQGFESLQSVPEAIEEPKLKKNSKIEKFGDISENTVLQMRSSADSNQLSSELQTNEQASHSQAEQRDIIKEQSNKEILSPTEKCDIIELSDEEDCLQRVEDSKQFCVWISDYQLKKDSQFTQGYYVYTVCSEILMDKESNKVTKSFVSRRYTDFKMLQQYFAETKQGDLIPSLPEKEGLIGSLFNLVRENTQKLTERVEQLQLFLRELTKYQEDQILISFLTIDQTFESILNNLRYQKGDMQDEDMFLPNPEDYKMKEKIKRIVTLSDYQTVLFDYLQGNTQIEAKFQEEYRQVQSHYKNLENKKIELTNFENELNKFYESSEKFSFPSNFIPLSVVTEANVAKTYEMQQIYNQFYFKRQNIVMNQVKQIKFQLNSLTYSYKRIEKQIFKWFGEKQRLRQDKTLNKKQIEQNDTEEGRLQFVISKTNDTLIKLVAQISSDLQNLLNDFVDELTIN